MATSSIAAKFYTGDSMSANAIVCVLFAEVSSPRRKPLSVRFEVKHTSAEQ